MKKSIRKRIRITSTGKIMRRQMAQDHFRAKRTGKKTRDKRKAVSFSAVEMKTLRKYF